MRHGKSTPTDVDGSLREFLGFRANTTHGCTSLVLFIYADLTRDTVSNVYNVLCSRLNGHIEVKQNKILNNTKKHEKKKRKENCSSTKIMSFYTSKINSVYSIHSLNNERSCSFFE